MVIHIFDIYFFPSFQMGWIFFLSHPPPKATLLCVPGGWPLGTASVSLPCPLSPGWLQPVGSTSRCRGQEEKEVKVFIPPTPSLLDLFLAIADSGCSFCPTTLPIATGVGEFCILLSPLLAPGVVTISNCLFFLEKENSLGASLVAQWLRICLPMQGTRVRALVWEDPTCRGATRPVSHNY